jgi:hypothetical protein
VCNERRTIAVSMHLCALRNDKGKRSTIDRTTYRPTAERHSASVTGAGQGNRIFLAESQRFGAC